MGTATPNFETGPRPGNSVAPSHAAKNPVVVVGLSLKAQICGLRVTSEVHILSHCCSFILKTTTCSLTLSRGGAKKCSNQVTSSKWSLTYFFKKWANPGLFCLFSIFSNTILQKNCILQRDSNSDRRSRRRARCPLDHHHGINTHLLCKGKYHSTYSLPPVWLVWIRPNK